MPTLWQMMEKWIKKIESNDLLMWIYYIRFFKKKKKKQKTLLHRGLKGYIFPQIQKESVEEEPIH